jgi:hypothetical protein
MVIENGNKLQSNQTTGISSVAPADPTKAKHDAVSKRPNIGLLVVVLGNAAALTGSIVKVNEGVQKVQDQLHLGTTPYLLYAVLAAILLGYLLTLTSLYDRLKHVIAPKLWLPKVAIGALAFAGIGTLCVYNLKAFSPAVTILGSRIQIWIDKLRGAQQEDGGFTVLLYSGPNNPRQVFTTAQALTAILTAENWDSPDKKHMDSIRKGLQYIDEHCGPQGEKGCGYFDNSQPLTEITGWISVARAKALQHADLVWLVETERVEQLGRIERDLDYIMLHYLPTEKAWSPFMLVNHKSPATTQCAPTIPKELMDLSIQPQTRTYSTIMALWALIEAHEVAAIQTRIGHKYDQVVRDGIGWLLLSYSTDSRSWVPNPRRGNQREDYLGLTAQVLYVLYRAQMIPDFKNSVEQTRWNDARQNFLKKEIKRQLLGDNSHLSDIDAYVFPYPQPLEPMTFLWSPWSLAAYGFLSADTTMTPSDRKLAKSNVVLITSNYQSEMFERIESGLTYELSENLICVADSFSRSTRHR